MFELKKAKRQRRPLKVNLEGVAGAGKAQPVDEPVLTPAGWRPIGELRVGDAVYGRDGLPCTVRAVYPQGVRPVFEVRFSDRTSTRCCDEHLWVVQRANGTGDRWHVWPLKEIRMAMADKYGRFNSRLRVPLTDPVQMPARDLPVHPYVLGCLLGDGCFRAKGVTLSTADSALIDRMRACDPTLEFTKCGGSKYDWYVRGVVGRIKALGLHGTDSGTKFIPNEYLAASSDQRRELLLGLCDTDGWRANGYVDVTVKSVRLADGIAYLARSLGYHVTVRSRKAPKCERIMALAGAGVSYGRIAEQTGSTPASVATTVCAMRKAGRTGSDHPGFVRVIIRSNDTNELVTLDRKKGDTRKGKYNPARMKMIDAITPAGEAECVCIAVDSPDHTYLTRDFIVTHNTFTALRLAMQMMRAGVGRRVAVLDSENESAGLYAGMVVDGQEWVYDHCPVPAAKRTPDGYVEGYEFLVSQGVDIIIADSLTHAWYGAQELVDRLASGKGDKFQAWAKVTPIQRRMLDTITDPRAHLIGTMRVKSEYERVVNERTGKEQMKKVGTKTDQREGAEYEFDCVVRMDKGAVPSEHVATVEKVRGCTAMDGRTGVNPGPEFWQPLLDWWSSAEPTVSPEEQHRQALAGAATLDALKHAWLAVPPQHQTALAPVKDRRKAELSGQQRPAPVAAPANPDADPVSDRDEIVTRICSYAASLKRKLPELIAGFARDLGCDPATPLDKLTAPQLETLAGGLEAAVDEAAGAAG